MKSPLHLLHLEDDPNNVVLEQRRKINRGGFWYCIILNFRPILYNFYWHSTSIFCCLIKNKHLLITFLSIAVFRRDPTNHKPVRSKLTRFNPKPRNPHMNQ
jgi:hypothetical protein